MTKKIIPFEISLKSSRKSGFTFQPRPQILTNDANSAELNFIITDASSVELTGSSATVLLFMKDGSFFQNTDVTRVNNTFVYTVKPNQAKHRGVAQAQLVIKIGSVENASPLMEFEIIGGLETKPIVERDIQDWTSLTAEAKAFVDQIEGFTLESFVENKMGQELANLEVNYAGRLTGLESADQTITAQLAQTDKRSNTEIISPRFQNRKPMFTILDDDCNSEVLTQWLPILEEKDFHLSLASITQRLIDNPSGLYLTIEQLKMLQKEHGVEVLSHTHTHPYLTDISDNEVRHQINTSRKMLQDNGFEGNVVVYPYGYSDVNVRKILKEEGFRGAVDARVREDYVNKPPVNTFNLLRPSLMYHGTPMPPLSYFTDLVDQAIAENGWIIFMSHSQFDSFDGTIIRGLIDYINARDTEWVSVNEGLDKIGNIIDYGDLESRDSGYNYTLLDADNELTTNSKTFGIYTYTDENFYSANDSIDKFPTGKVTQTVIHGGNQNNIDFPENQSGMLFTYNFGGTGWQRQEYRPYNKNEIWSRIVTSSGEWGAWLKINDNRLITFSVSQGFGTIPSNSRVANEFTIAGATDQDVVHVNFAYGIPSGVIPIAYVSGSNKVIVRLENVTSSPIEFGSRPIRIGIIKA